MTPMRGIFQWPAPLLRKWLMLALIGLSCFVIGVIMLAINRDIMFLGLSMVLVIMITVRCVILYHRIDRKAYQTLEGVCVSIITVPLQREHSLKIKTDLGKEKIVLTDNRSIHHVGARYRIYIIRSSVQVDKSPEPNDWDIPTAFAVEEV